MAPNYNDDWDTEETSNFRAPVHPFDGKVKRAAFLTDPNYQGGAAYRLNLIVDVMAPGTAAVIKGDHEIWITLGGRAEKGTDWFSTDGGKSVENRAGAKVFQTKSQMGVIVEGIKKLRASGDAQAVALTEKGSVKSAAVYEGVTFRFDDVELFAGKDEAGNDKTRAYELITGVVSVSGAAAANGSGPDDFEEKAKVIALASESFEIFKDSAMSAGLASDVSRFKSRVLVESGIWAETHPA